MLHVRARSRIWRFLRERKGDVDTSRRRLGVFAPTGGDDDELAAIHFVGGRSGVAGKRESRLPKPCTGGLIKGAEFFVEVGCSDKQQSARGNDRAAVIFRAGVLLA